MLLQQRREREFLLCKR